MRRELTVPAADGFPLSAVLHEPGEGAGDGSSAGGSPPRAAVVIAPAMGVRKRYYDPFAAYLAGAGFATLCFDYRGIGGSLPGRLRGFRARLHEWGEEDLEGALGWLAGRWPGAPLLVVCHSVGGQVLGLAPGIDRVRAVLAVGAQSGYWRWWPGVWRWALAFFWYCWLPALVTLFGYLPMRLASGGEDVPAGVAREWARWGRHPDYVLSHARARGGTGYAHFDRPLRAYGFTDDLLAPPRAVEQLLTFYPNAQSDLRILAPADLGVKAIGHFAPFRDRFRDTLWAEWREWLERAAG
jgi:predicted alpha/beta hydrolase